MKFTATSALKHIKFLEDEKQKILEQERNNSTSIIVDGSEIKGEDYNFKDIRVEIGSIDSEIVKIKHALNLFNTSTLIADGITLDMALVILAQKNRELEIVRCLRSKPKESYENNYGESYRKRIKFSHDEVDEYHKSLMREIHSLQIKIDEANMSKILEIE